MEEVSPHGVADDNERSQESTLRADHVLRQPQLLPSVNGRNQQQQMLSPSLRFDLAPGEPSNSWKNKRVSNVAERGR